MIDFTKELLKFKPAKTADDVKRSGQTVAEMTDVIDCLKFLLESEAEKKPAQTHGQSRGN
ncbi:MAG: hypothetical protein FWC95_02840 [Defluviitaleaceae bacterium]|nr:hypothetical protein [Defluviitaleaceae bacterium]